MKGLIIYTSNYGSTRSYAEWISLDTGFECLPVGKLKKSQLSRYEVIVIGSPVFADKPILSGWIRRNWKLLKDRKIILFTTSGAERKDPVLVNGVVKSLGPEIASSIDYHPLDGRMVMAELSSFHRFLIKLGKKLEKDPEIRVKMDRDTNRMDRDEIAPIVHSLSG